MEEANKIKLAQEIKASVMGLAQFQAQLQQSLKDPLEAIAKLQQQIQVYMKNNLQEIQNSISICIPKLKEISENMPKKQKLLAERMIKSGWYYSLELPLDAYKLLELNEQDFDEVLIEFYEQYEEDMINRIKDQYPHRKHILSKVYEAHKRGDYELSIPVMFTQSDGIAFELFNSSLFSRRNNKPLTNYQTEVPFDEGNPIDICFIIQTATIGQLNMKYVPDNYKDCIMFNRHTVLHGKDVNYGKKINSIKCLAILNFLAEIKENYCEDITLK